MLRYLTAGESHGPALVVVVEGLPAGLAVTVEDVQGELFWPLDDDMLAGWIPPDHVVVLWPFEEAWVVVSGGERGKVGRVETRTRRAL